MTLTSALDRPPAGHRRVLLLMAAVSGAALAVLAGDVAVGGVAGGAILVAGLALQDSSRFRRHDAVRPDAVAAYLHAELGLGCVVATELTSAYGRFSALDSGGTPYVVTVHWPCQQSGIAARVSLRTAQPAS